MAPPASLQSGGDREAGVRRGPGPGCAGGGRAPSHTPRQDPAPLPGPGPGGPRGRWPHGGAAARAGPLRAKAARAPDPPRCRGPVLRPTFPRPRREVTAAQCPEAPPRAGLSPCSPRTVTETAPSPRPSSRGDQSEPSSLWRPAPCSLSVSSLKGQACDC